MVQRETLSCPVCRARFRDELVCSRCGADLAPLAALAARAFAVRQAAAAALRTGDFAAAAQLAARARALHATPHGRRLRALTSMLIEIHHTP